MQRPANGCRLAGAKPVTSSGGDLKACRCSHCRPDRFEGQTSNPRTGSASTGPNSSEWIAVSRCADISDRWHGQAHGQAGDRALRAGGPACQALMTSLRRWLPEVAQPNEARHGRATKGLVTLALSAETSMAVQRAEVAARTQALQDPVGLRSDLEFLIACYDRRDRGLPCPDRKSLQRLVRARSICAGVSASKYTADGQSAGSLEEEPRLPSLDAQETWGRSTPARSVVLVFGRLRRQIVMPKWLGLMPVTTAQKDEVPSQPLPCWLSPRGFCDHSGRKTAGAVQQPALHVRRCLNFHASTICTALAETGRAEPSLSAGRPEVV